jgi:Protein of unknown function (DUF3592)
MNGSGFIRRRVPLVVRLALPVSGTFRQLSWLFVVIGSAFSALFLSMTERPFRSFDAFTEGEVLKVERTNSSQNDEYIYAVEVQYHADGAPGGPLKVTSFTTEPPEVGARITVEYDSSDPSDARMQGARTHRFSSWVSFVAALPIMGLLFALLQLGDALRAVRLLARGSLTKARLTGKGEGNLRLNEVPQSVMRFVFLDEHGVEVPFEVKTFKPKLLEDDREELALYDPRRPRQAMTVDQLPGKLEVQDDRVIAHAALAHLLILPLLGVASIAAAGYFTVAF